MRIRTLAAGLPALALAGVAIIGGTAAIATASTCPSSNPPDEMVVSGGTPQTTKIGMPFETNLAVLKGGLDLPIQHHIELQ